MELLGTKMNVASLSCLLSLSPSNLENGNVHDNDDHTPLLLCIFSVVIRVIKITIIFIMNLIRNNLDPSPIMHHLLLLRLLSLQPTDYYMEHADQLLIPQPLVLPNKFLVLACCCVCICISRCICIDTNL